MIPILACPILTGPELLWKMLRSIDVEVGEVIVIDNGDCIHEVPDDLGVDFTHVWPGYNMGVAASWNHVIKMRPLAPWWSFVGFDIELAPGDLQRLTDHMHGVGGVALLGTFSAFALDREAVRRVGLFDENYVPGYYEDNDYDYRCRLEGIPLTGLPAGLRHAISSTLRSSVDFERRNAYTFARNYDYFERKWGGAPCSEVFRTPFDRGGDPAHWTLEFDRLADQSWTREER